MTGVPKFVQVPCPACGAFLIARIERRPDPDGHAVNRDVWVCPECGEPFALTPTGEQADAGQTEPAEQAADRNGAAG